MTLVLTLILISIQTKQTLLQIVVKFFFNLKLFEYYIEFF